MTSAETSAASFDPSLAEPKGWSLRRWLAPFAVGIAIRIGATRSQDRAAAWEDAANGCDIEWEPVPFQRPTPPVTESNELVLVDLDSLPHHCTDHGIQTRAVAPASQDSYTH